MYKVLSPDFAAEFIRMVGSENYGTDLRNRASHELCKRIVESGLLDDAHLPFI